MLRSLIVQEAHERGVLFTGSHIPSSSLIDEDVEFALDTYRECLEVLAEAVEAGDVEDRLDGGPIGAPLRGQDDD